MMREEERYDDGEVSVVLADRGIPSRRCARANHEDLCHRLEVLAACVMGLNTFSGGVLEGYTSPAIPSLLHNATIAPSTTTPIISTTTPIATHATTLLDLTTEAPTTLIPTTIIPTILASDSIIPTTIEPTILPSFVEENVTLARTAREAVNFTFSGIEKEKIFTELHITEEEASWLGSLLLFGACLGALCSSWVIGLGRRRGVLASALPRIVGWAMIAAASDVYMMYGGRFLTGVSIGMITSAAPVYISEVAHSSVRGALSCVVQLGVNLGIFSAALFGTFIAWRGLALYGVVTVVVYFVCTLFIPDSPVWLVAGGREDEARRALQRLRGNKYSVDFELQQIVSAKASQYSQYSWREVMSQRCCYVPLGVVMLVTLVNRCSGYNAIITFCATFLHQAVPAVSQYWAANAVTLMQVLSTVLAAVLVDRVGRRRLLLGSIAAMAASLATIAVCEMGSTKGAGGSWVAVFATIVYVSAYSVGVGPITWVLVGEMFPQAARDKAAAIIAVLNWFLAFVVTKTYFGLESLAGIAGVCFIYSSVCVVGFIACFVIVPETKGRTLGEIEAYFTYTKLPWKSRKNATDVDLSSILEAEGRPGESYSTFGHFE